MVTTFRRRRPYDLNEIFVHTARRRRRSIDVTRASAIIANRLAVVVLIQCLMNTIFAKLMLVTILKQPRDLTKPAYYASSALTYLVAMVSSNMALQHVNYPTQVIGKSCKPIPVMILGVLIGRKSCSLLKYLFVLMIVGGVGIFMN